MGYISTIFVYWIKQPVSLHHTYSEPRFRLALSFAILRKQQTNFLYLEGKYILKKWCLPNLKCL